MNSTSSLSEPSPTGYWYDEDAAERVVNFIERFCSHVKGHTGPFLLEEWQKNDIIRPLFGWKRADGRRKFRQCYIEIPRKNGKSNLVAAIALYLLVAEQEEGAEIISAAGDRNQARIVFDIAAAMVGQNKNLSSRCRTLQHAIYYKNSFYKSISAEARTKHGFNCSAVLFDELHTQRDRELYDVLTTSVAAREQPLIIMLTTAGYDTTSICYEVHDYAERVLSGEVVDETFLPVLYRAAKDDDWTQEATWRKANPGFGTICKAEYFEQEVAKCQANPAVLNTFLRLHLNIWTGADSAWITDAEFMRGAVTLPPDDYLAKLPCWGGLDLASTRDLTAFALIFKDERKGLYYLKVHQFVNEERSQMRKSEGVDYLRFERDGDLTITAGNVTDFRVVRDHILAAADKFQIQAVAYDQRFSTYIVPDLIDEGVDMQPMGQGFLHISTPTKMFEMEMLKGTLIHGGNACLRWQMGCVKIDRDAADNIKVTKNRSRFGQMVDGVVASIMAYGAMLNGDDGDDVITTVITL
jgi:phage terminase large subunit-like protein